MTDKNKLLAECLAVLTMFREMNADYPELDRLIKEIDALLNPPTLGVSVSETIQVSDRVGG